MTDFTYYHPKEHMVNVPAREKRGLVTALFCLYWGLFFTYWIPGLGRSPGGGHGNTLQYSCQKTSWAEEPGGLQWNHKELDVTGATDYARSLSDTMYISHTFRVCVLDDCWWWVTGRTAGREVTGRTVTGSASWLHPWFL